MTREIEEGSCWHTARRFEGSWSAVIRVFNTTITKCKGGVPTACTFRYSGSVSASQKLARRSRATLTAWVATRCSLETLLCQPLHYNLHHLSMAYYWYISFTAPANQWNVSVSLYLTIPCPHFIWPKGNFPYILPHIHTSTLQPWAYLAGGFTGLNP